MQMQSSNTPESQPKKKGHRWPKGVSGNPAGRKTDRVLSVWETIRKRLLNDPEQVQELADTFLEMLASKHWGAWQDYLDRTEGKVGSSLTVNGTINVANPLDGLIGQALIAAAKAHLLGQVGVAAPARAIEGAGVVDETALTVDAVEVTPESDVR